MPIFAGTDAGGTSRTAGSPTRSPRWSGPASRPTAALGAACWDARAWLGRPGLEEGETADLLVYPEDPRRDVSVLAHPRLRVLRGRTVA